MARWLAGVAAIVAGGVFLAALRIDEEPPAPPTAAVSVAVPISWREQSLVVARRTPVVLYDRPGGRPLSRVHWRTEFGSPEVLSPTGGRRGSWLKVRHTSLGNAGLGWVDLHDSGFELVARPVRLDVDLSERKLVIAGAGEPRQISVAVGAPATPTPPGTYYVTDKLPGARYGDFYGCCILALSGRQPNLPQGWSGGDRLAIHGSPTPTWGKNVSNGCLHAREADLRYLMRLVPLGTVVTVRA